MFGLVLSLLVVASAADVIAVDVDPWVVSATDIDPSNYYGVTVANGLSSKIARALTRLAY